MILLFMNKYDYYQLYELFNSDYNEKNIYNVIGEMTILIYFTTFSAKGLFKILEKYRPETEAVRKERLRKAAEAKVSLNLYFIQIKLYIHI